MFSETAWPTPDQIAEAVIATVMIDRDAGERAIELLSPEDFPPESLTGQPFQGIWSAVVSLVGKGKRSAAPLLALEMKRLGVAPKRRDGSNYDISRELAAFTRSYTAGVPIEQYAKVLHDYAQRVRFRTAGHKLVDLANDDQLDPETRSAMYEGILNDAKTREFEDDEPKKMGELLAKRMELHMTADKGKYTGLRTGFKELDRKLRGLQPADLIIVAARPSMGKTALAENIADYVAGQGGSVLFISREMTPEQLADRTIASEGCVDGGSLRAAMATQAHLEQAEKDLRKSGLYEAKYFIDDTSRTVAQIRTKALRVKRKYGINLLVVDYLQLLSGTPRFVRSTNKVLEVGEISHDLKALAKELKIPVIALAQLSRAVESHKDEEGKHRPLLSHLRESGDVEQDADLVLFLYRDDYYANLEKRSSSAPGRAEVIIAKNRNGPLGVVELEFVPSRCKFLNIQGDNRD